jgi:hypothetical protein
MEKNTDAVLIMCKFFRLVFSTRRRQKTVITRLIKNEMKPRKKTSRRQDKNYCIVMSSDHILLRHLLCEPDRVVCCSRRKYGQRGAVVKRRQRSTTFLVQLTETNYADMGELS